MSASVTQKPTTASLSATITEHALLLFLPHAEPQSLWRFDLDGLTEHAFCVTARDGYYDLSVTSLDGDDHVLTRFLDKQDARDALSTIHATLSSPRGGNCKSSCRTGSAGKGLLRFLFGWMTFWRLLFLILLACLVMFFTRPSGISGDVTTEPTAQTQSKPLPSGVPLDADSVLQ